MINIKMLPDGVEIRGHAGAGDYGHDLVCAAVSTLLLTLTEALESVGRVQTRVIESGYALVTTTDRHSPYLDMAQVGFRLLGRKYPEHVNYFSCRYGREI